MANIATGLKKRGSKYLYEANFAGAVECFTRVYMMSPDDIDNIIELIYSLNQNGDYAASLTYCYGLLGEKKIENPDTLYFLTAEAFGGAGCVEGCAQMLEKCIKTNPDGPNSKDAQAFLNDLKQKYTVNEYDTSTDAVTMTLPNGITDAPFLNYETLLCMKDVSTFIQNEDIQGAIKRIEEEVDTGNVSISLLGVGIMMGAEAGDMPYVKRNAERFKFVEDYTASELYALAYNLSDLNDDGIAYTVYRELYSKESGEKDIAFGFAVACERIGDLNHARELASQVLASDGGRGPASYYLSEIGSKKHSYMLKYEGDCEQKIIDSVSWEGRLSYNQIFEMIDYLRFASVTIGTSLINRLDAEDFFTRLELRRAAINPQNNLVLRARAAARVFEKNETVYLNTGSDIVEFTPEIEKVINNFFERGIQ